MLNTCTYNSFKKCNCQFPFLVCFNTKKMVVLYVWNYQVTYVFIPMISKMVLARLIENDLNLQKNIIVFSDSLILMEL